ncbi:peptide chain release factor N(5)-glutamine methyltransferase [Microbacterium esteraromaticum]|uniref:Release factor glutamine methyltransferase n=1 Tax=Microbacterium esteraromaticum TaxID=57043 RepID=A0A939DVS4_9MICO|nr:peptide chain release factor N(5)-glutamine methyltransferase [Microbacterium esteraromaticum]MBN8205800.1 peptide chain release factor N(5)-glutamine methyltransferase [Microbacterium esteraromaticum]MBN8415954.1 peptide chain release factor N(5)-glutamine methyltransferase [Microbacterium esteraromaticum]
MPDSLAAFLRAAAQRLAEAGVPDPSVDTELLAGHVLGQSRGGVQAAALRGDAISSEAAEAVTQLVSRRADREPLQHLTGLAAFRNLELAVGPGVFVPRPETETVVQYAIDALLENASDSPLAIDLGTGSGAIALAMATEVPHARVFAVERSEQAYAWAKLNVTGVENLTLVHGDLATAFDELRGRVDVVISNPPYVPDEAVPRDPEVRLHDPAAALYGGPDGLDVVRIISRRAADLLHAGGLLVLEHGELQGEAIRGILTADGWRAAATHEDLTRRDRVTTALRG